MGHFCAELCCSPKALQQDHCHYHLHSRQHHYGHHHHHHHYHPHHHILQNSGFPKSATAALSGWQPLGHLHHHWIGVNHHHDRHHHIYQNYLSIQHISNIKYSKDILKIISYKENFQLEEVNE